MDKKLLELGIKKLKELRRIEEKINSSLKLLYPEMNFFCLGKIESDYLILLKKACGDTHDWISYFVYDCEFGKKAMKVNMPNGKTIKMKSVKDLYYVMTH